MSEKAILVPANPKKDYIIAPNQTSKLLGDVVYHIAHLTRNGGVFWDIVPPGRNKEAPWKHPDIHSGYFYISGEQKVRYWMDIEYIKRWSEIDLDEADRYIPEPRKSYLRYYDHTITYYAIKIRQINSLEPEHRMEDFILFNTRRNVQRVQNYVLIQDPGWR